MREAVHWLVVLADEQNMTSAAAVLGTPQPTLSRRLRRLEDHLGARLFDRSGRRLALNEAGEAYVAYARRADAALAAAEQAVLELRDATPRVVHLGFLHSFGTWLVPRLIQRAQAARPGLRFDLVQDAAETITEQVVAGALDLGIVAPRPQRTQLRWRPLLRQEVSLIVPATHLLGAARSVDFGDLRDEPFVAMQRGFGMRQLLDEATEAAGFAPRIIVECQELDTVSGLVAAGIGIGLLPDVPGSTVPAGVSRLHITGVDATREVGMIWSRDHPLSDVAREVRDQAG